MDIAYAEKKLVWQKIPRGLATQKGWEEIKSCWIDISTGDDENPLYRSRKVGKQFNMLKRLVYLRKARYGMSQRKRCSNVESLKAVIKKSIQEKGKTFIQFDEFDVVDKAKTNQHLLITQKPLLAELKAIEPGNFAFVRKDVLAAMDDSADDFLDGFCRFSK